MGQCCVPKNDALEPNGSGQGMLESKESPSEQERPWKYGDEASIARGDQKGILSVDLPNAARTRLRVVNNSGSPIILCWITPEGLLRGNYRVNDGSIRDGSVSSSHVELTQLGHAFVAFRPIELSASARPDRIADLFMDGRMGSAVYRPMRAQPGGPACEHVWDIYTRPGSNFLMSRFRFGDPIPSSSGLINTANKPYEKSRIAGWTVFSEPNLYKSAPRLRGTLLTDLKSVNVKFPERALRILQKKTAIWVNKSISWGQTTRPERGRGLTYHPAKEWLLQHKMNPKKAGCVEIYNASDYMADRELWGAGGVLAHELAHAYHNTACKDGFDNAKVWRAFDNAMDKGLYDAVKVHGSQGVNGKAKAYAATNRMEYFAELSVAYLCADKDVEFNKWYPFNRVQLESHDRVGFEVLQDLWECRDV